MVRAGGKVVVECPRGGIEVVAGLAVVVVGVGAVSMGWKGVLIYVLVVGLKGGGDGGDSSRWCY